LTFGDFELHCVAFLQALVSFGRDRAVVNENIGPVGAADETISFSVVEPLDGSFQAFHVPPLSARPLYSGAQDVHAVLYDAFWSEGVGVSRESQKAEVDEPVVRRWGNLYILCSDLSLCYSG
jgi:hypothetical protein